MSDLRCPLCRATRISVIDTRTQYGASVRRKRKCGACGHRWATIEITEDVFRSLMSTDTLAHQHRVIEKAIAQLTALLPRPKPNVQPDDEDRPAAN